MKISDDFLWGGSIAAHQCEGAYDEGGKGLGIMDLVSVGAYGQPRKIYSKLEKNVLYPHTMG